MRSKRSKLGRTGAMYSGYIVEHGIYRMKFIQRLLLLVPLSKCMMNVH